MKFRLSLVSLAVSCALVPQAALAFVADETDLFDEIAPVFSASKMYEDPLASPAAVTVIDARQIRERGYRSLAEALADVRGLWVETDRGYDYVGPRELSRVNDYNSRYLLLVDGHRTNDGGFGGALFGEGLDLVDIGLVERIEVMRGGSSILYGSAAVLGVIAVTTRAPGSGPQVETTASVGSQRSAAARLTLSNTTAGIDWIASVSALRSAGEGLITYRDHPELVVPDTSPTWYARDLDDTRAVQASLRLRKGEFGLNVYFQQRDDGLPTWGVGRIGAGLFPAGDDPFPNGTYSSQLDQRILASLTWDRVVAGGELAARLGVNQYDFRGNWYSAYGDCDADYFCESQLQRAWSSESSLSWGAEADWSRRWGAHTVNLGAEYRYQPRIHSTAWHDNGMVDWDTALTRSNWRVFAQDSFDATDWLRLNLGVAYDQYQYSQASITPRFAAVVRPSQSQSVKLLWGRSIRAPNGSELESYTSQAQSAAERVKDENAVSTGVVWEGRAAGGGRLERFAGGLPGSHPRTPAYRDLY